MQLAKIIIIFIVFIGLSFIYKKIKMNEDTRTNGYYYTMIEKYLLNKDNLGGTIKPILWVYLQNNTAIIPEVNSRFWLNFGSRSTTNFNQPYQKLTIQSIINKCSDDFNICLIDDSAFNILIPNWNINLKKTALPLKSYIQTIALTSLLNAYGGLLIPSSFICFKSLKGVYEEILKDDKILVAEFKNRVCNEKLTSNVIPYPILMGCKPNSRVMQNYNNYLSVLASTDFTAEQDFLGKSNLWLEEQIQLNQVKCLSGISIGTQKKNGDTISTDELVGSPYVDICENALGLYIPWDELINRIKLQWFVRLSPEQVLKSDTFIGKKLLVNQCKCCK